MNLSSFTVTDIQGCLAGTAAFALVLLALTHSPIFLLLMTSAWSMEE